MVLWIGASLCRGGQEGTSKALQRAYRVAEAVCSSIETGALRAKKQRTWQENKRDELVEFPLVLIRTPSRPGTLAQGVQQDRQNSPAPAAAPTSPTKQRGTSCPPPVAARHSPSSSNATPASLPHPRSSNSPLCVGRSCSAHHHRRTVFDRRDLVRHLQRDLVSYKCSEGLFEAWRNASVRLLGGSRLGRRREVAGRLPSGSSLRGVAPGEEGPTRAAVRRPRCTCIRLEGPATASSFHPSCRRGPAADLLASSTGSSSSTRARSPLSNAAEPS